MTKDVRLTNSCEDYNDVVNVLINRLTNDNTIDKFILINYPLDNYSLMKVADCLSVKTYMKWVAARYYQDATIYIQEEDYSIVDEYFSD